MKRPLFLMVGVLAGILGATPSPGRIRSLSADLRYEFQRTRLRWGDQRLLADRMMWGVFLEGRGYIYHRRFLSFYGRGFLEGERWRGQPVQRFTIARRSPYDLRLTFLPYRPVTLNLRAFRQVDTTEQSSDTETPWAVPFETTRIEQTLSAGLASRWAEFRYDRTSVNFETLDFSRESRFQHWMAALYRSRPRYRWTLQADLFRYEAPERFQTFQIQTTWTRRVDVPAYLLATLQFWRDTTFFWADFNRTDEARRKYLFGNVQLTRMPDFLWANGTGRYEAPLRANLRFVIEPAVSLQTFRGTYASTGSVRTGLGWGPTWRGWSFYLTPSVEVSYYTGTESEGLGYGAGLTGSAEHALGRGRLRGEAGGDYAFRPIGPGYESRSFRSGISWTGFLVDRVHLFAFARWGWEQVTSGSVQATLKRPHVGAQLNWPRLRVQLRAEASDTVWNGVPHRQRFWSATLAPLRLGPVTAGLTYTAGRANGTRYRTARGDLRWQVGRFRFTVVGTNYQISGPAGRAWWDVRFLVQRPLPFVQGPERPPIYR
ncbi:hypothetical protein HRbin11_00603 [bacterium HR11]|nr:hypothetical protein HRbin11_00603 [bacterium HR11]